MLFIAFYMDYNWVWREVQLAFNEVHHLFFSCFKSQLRIYVVLPTVLTSSNGSGLGLNPELNSCNGVFTWQPWTVAFGLDSTLKPALCKPRCFASIKYWISDRIKRWSIHRLCSVSGSSTSRFQLCDTTNIGWVAIENPRISHDISSSFTTTQQILVGSQICKREVKERLKLHNLHVDHVSIWSELKYFIGANAVGTRKLKPRSGSNSANNPWLDLHSGYTLPRQ
jgi:hypothetical protein